ncbi:hypothetical protein SAMN06296273_2252 [Nitrosomonas ureae]|uniref:Uncharacterized protein n=1 Tax=Nitrosomonas ureae TaxID=44577 RepID=A0A285BZP7_9PROT|nr:hypothetical protein [Nitrosomonas ureae]SNX60784.1 hypothetical protein SAMN06296273_2252 [Nitrosomonas ureae]
MTFPGSPVDLQLIAQVASGSVGELLKEWLSRGVEHSYAILLAPIGVLDHPLSMQGLGGESIIMVRDLFEANPDSAVLLIGGKRFSDIGKEYLGAY